MSLNELLLDETIVLSAKPNVSNRIKHLSSSVSPILVAISGESAAGKTTFLNTLSGIFKNASFVDTDHYFNDISKAIKEKEGFAGLVNSGYESDAPTSFQLDKLCVDLSRLKQGLSIRTPHYDMASGKSIPDKHSIHSAPIVFAAGICTLYQPVSELFDFKIYLQPDKLEQRLRYFRRAAERGQCKNIYELYGQFYRVCQMAEKYIVPTKSEADIVLKGRLPKPILKRKMLDFVRGISKE